MPSAGKKDRINRARPMGIDAALEPCPKCGAAIGERCTKPFGGKRISTADPHAARVELVRRMRKSLSGGG